MLNNGGTGRSKGTPGEQRRNSFFRDLGRVFLIDGDRFSPDIEHPKRARTR